jgi:hypothetical protein
MRRFSSALCDSAGLVDSRKRNADFALYCLLFVTWDLSQHPLTAAVPLAIFQGDRTKFGTTKCELAPGGVSDASAISWLLTFIAVQN